MTNPLLLNPFPNPVPGMTPEVVAINTRGQDNAIATAFNTHLTNSWQNVKDWGAKGDGVTDDTATIAKVTTYVAAHGGTVYMPPSTYKITGDILLSAPMTLFMDDVTINSTAGRIRGTSSNVVIDGDGTSTLNFSSGSPASSLDRAVRIEGAWNGTVLGISASINAGDSTFTATNAGDVSGLVLNQWLLIGEWVLPTQQMRVEWKQVKSVSSTTVTVTSPFRLSYSLYSLGFTILTPNENTIVRGLKIVTSNTTDDNYGVDAEICRNFLLEDCRFDVAKGMAWQVYWQDAPTVRRNMVDRQVGRRSSIGTWQDGYCGYNRFGSKTSFCTEGALSIETGAAWNLIEGNSAYGTGGSGVFAVQLGSYNKIMANTIISDGTSIGIYVFGGDSNTTAFNEIINVVDGVRFDEAAIYTPHFPADRNVSIGDKVRVATHGVYVRSAATNSSVYFVDTDSTVTTPVLDSGSNTSLLNASNSTGLFAFPAGTTMAQQFQLTGGPYNVTQVLFGDSSMIGSVGTRYSGGDLVVATNAYQTLGADQWNQSNGASASLLMRMQLNGSIEFYTAPSGTSAANMATFWTLIGQLDIDGFVNMITSGGYKIASLKGLSLSTGPTKWHVGDGTNPISLDGNVAVLSGSTFQLGTAYSAGVVAATGTIPIKDNTGTVYNVLVHT